MKLFSFIQMLPLNIFYPFILRQPSTAAETVLELLPVSSAQVLGSQVFIHHTLPVLTVPVRMRGTTFLVIGLFGLTFTLCPFRDCIMSRRNGKWEI